MARRHPNKTEKLAACLLMLGLVPERIRKNGTPEELCRSVDWHHDVQFAIKEHNDPRLITPMRPADHDARFAKDIVEISRVKRGLKKRAQAPQANPAFLATFSAVAPPRERSARAKPKRLMQYTAMKATHKRTFSGKTVERQR